MPCQPPEPVEVLVRRLDAGLPLPAYAHPGDAGADLRTTVDAVVAPGERVVLPTGVAVALPAGHAAFVHPRSGLAARFGVALVNSPGTIDAGYRGEVQVILVNLDPREPVRLRRGDRVAQLVVQRVEVATFREVDALPSSARGEGGFGSTGGHGEADDHGHRVEPSDSVGRPGTPGPDRVRGLRPGVETPRVERPGVRRGVNSGGDSKASGDARVGDAEPGVTPGRE